MGRRILLFSVNQYDFPYPVFPLGLAQVDAALVRAGHTTHVVDYNVNLRPVAGIISEFKPEFIGISLRNIDDALIGKQETFFDVLLKLVAELRRHTAVPVVLGGSGFSIFPEELLNASGADYGIQGEGEGQFLSLIEALSNREDHKHISGLVYREQDTVRVNARSCVEPSEEIPTATRSESFVDHYLRTSSMLNLQTQRGCALHCCYCTYPLLEGRQYRRRPAEAVADELQNMEEQGARYVFIVDSVFNTSPAHVKAICEAILKRGLRLKWCCFLRPKNLTHDLLQLMARAGLAHVEFGSDSLCDSVLRAYGKGLTFNDILRSSELAAAAKIDCAHFLILGGPGETEATMEETFANSRRLPDPILMARVGMRVYPGTPLFDQLNARQGSQPLPPLLKPYYHIEPPLTQASVLARLSEVAREMPNWIYDDPPPQYYKMAERLRARGIVGPLWSYFAMLQRLGGTVPSSAESG